MLGVLTFQGGLVLLATALVAAVLPPASIGPRRGLVLVPAGVGLALVLAGALLPARERRATRRQTILDDYAPAWHFAERHERRIAADPERVYDAARTTTPDEIRIFQLLTWLRRFGRPLPPGILAAPSGEPIIDTAVRGGFVLLAEDRPREIVIGAVVVGRTGCTSR